MELTWKKRLLCDLIVKGDDGEGGNKCDGGYGWEAGYHVDDGEQV